MAVRRLPHDWYPDELPAGVVLGERSWLYSSFAFIHSRSQRAHPVRIGADTGVYHGTFFELGPTGEVCIGDWCSVVGATFCTNAVVSVEDYCFIAHEVVIADEFGARPWVEKAATDREAPPAVTIGPNAWIGARAVLLGGVSVGEDAVVAAGAVVSQPVPARCVVAGNPARVVRRFG